MMDCFCYPTWVCSQKSDGVTPVSLKLSYTNLLHRVSSQTVKHLLMSLRTSSWTERQADIIRQMRYLFDVSEEHSGSTHRLSLTFRAESQSWCSIVVEEHILSDWWQVPHRYVLLPHIRAFYLNWACFHSVKNNRGTRTSSFILFRVLQNTYWTSASVILFHTLHFTLNVRIWETHFLKQNLNVKLQG